MVWYDKEGRTNPTQEGEFQYSGPPGQAGNPGLSAEESRKVLEGLEEKHRWFRYDSGSYGVTKEDSPPENATFVDELPEFQDAVEAGTDFSTDTFVDAGSVISEATNPTGANNSPEGGSDGSETPTQNTNTEGSENPALKQLPQGSKIIKVGDEYRIVLEFSDGLGAAWYDMTSVQWANLGSPNADEVLNLDSFIGKYGDFYFGNLNEIEVNGDVAWKEMTKSIFAEYGQYVPLDNLELKRMVMQAYLEGWDGEQTKQAYKNTNYYNAMTEQARAFKNMSTAEQAAEIERTQYKMLAHHIYEYGENPSDGITSFLADATKVAKGEIGLDGAYFNITSNAEAVEGSSAHRRLSDQAEAKNKALGEAQGWLARVLDAHNTYLGNHIAVDNSHYDSIAQNLTTGVTDWNTELAAIQNASASIHKNKDPLLTWNQYSSGAKGVVKGALEIENIASDDSLLNKILSEELSGKDLDKAIRADSRFLNTVRAKDELTSSINSLGKSMGFET